MKQSLIVVCTLISLSARAWVVSAGQDIRELSKFRPSLSVYTEMNKFFLKNGSSTNASNYVENFINGIHSAMILEAGNSVSKKLNESSCVSASEVAFPEHLTKLADNELKQNFEENFLKVQSYACLGRINLDRLFEVLMSENFQKSAVPGLKAITTNPSNNQVCIKTSMMLIGDSEYCLTKNVLKSKNQYFIHAFNESNGRDATAQIYFKETINVLTQLENGEASLYTLMYMRGPDLSFRPVVKSTVNSQQKKINELLINMSK